MVNFKTMLAQKTDEKRINFEQNDYYVQPKLDGVRCYITKDGMFSRNHKPIVSAPHIFEGLKEFFAEYGDGVILDGELYNHEYHDNFNKIISLVRKTKPTQADLKESALKVEFHCYDMYPVEDPGMVFSDRREFLVREVYNNLAVVGVETHQVSSLDHAKKLNQSWLDAGYEGSMIRQDAEYQQKRSWYLQKVKVFVDEEFEIVGFVEREKRTEDGVKLEQSIPQGMIGKFICKTASGREFGAPPGEGFNHDDLKEIWENRESYVGKQATIVFFGYTPAGSPRFPKFKTLRNYE